MENEYVISECGELLRCTAENPVIPSGVTSIANGAFPVDDLKITVRYTSARFAAAKGLDYEKENLSFFALISFAERSPHDERIILNVLGDMTDDEFAEAECDDKFGLSKVREVNFLEGTVAIHENILHDLPEVKAVYLPASVRHVNKHAFRMSAVESIAVSPDNPLFSSCDGILFTKDETVLLKFPPEKKLVSFDIPSCVTEIASCAFEDAFFVGSLYLSSPVFFCELSLHGMPNLEFIVIPDSARDSIFHQFAMGNTTQARILAPMDADGIVRYCKAEGVRFLGMGVDDE